MERLAPGHDIIVVGASAGGVEALTKLVSRLPADLPVSSLRPTLPTAVTEAVNRRRRSIACRVTSQPLVGVEVPRGAILAMEELPVWGGAG